MLNRYNGNVEPFAKNSTGTNRTIFGDTVQSDDIDDNLNTDFKRGWEIVGVNDNPTKQDFNALAYTISNLISYIYQQGVPEWSVGQKYYVGSRCIGSDNKAYKSIDGTELTPNVGNDPVSEPTKWELDTVDISQFVDKTTAQTIGGIKTFTAFPITPSTPPTNNYQVANKKYVDDNIGSGVVVEANSQAEEDAAFLAGATIVIRLDLLTSYTIQLLLHMDGTAGGTTFTDSSVNGAAMSVLAGTSTQTTAPQIGTANMETTSGGSSGLYTPDSPALRFGSQDFTIEGFIKLTTTSTAGHHFMASKGADGSLSSWYLALLNGGNMGFMVDNGSTLNVSASFAAYMNTTTWTHVSLNREGNVYKLYFNGVLAQTVTSSAVITENTGNLHIGRWNYSTANVNNVKLDEFVIVTGGVLRTADFTPPTTPIG